MTKTLQDKNVLRMLVLFKEGDERGLNYIYDRFFAYLFFRVSKTTGDECSAQSIVHESFLRLWLCRDQANSLADIFDFLKAQVRIGIGFYFKKSSTRFQRSLLQLDAIDDYQEFMLADEVEEEDNEDNLYLDQQEKDRKLQLDKLQEVLPHINKQQQLFIRLCLKYSFNYERIAYYLGGISDYEVSLQVERAIATLKAVFESSQKIESVKSASSMKLEGELSDEQASIFRMRYELQYSFEQIAEALNLSASRVRLLFVQAHAEIKRSKKTA